MSVGDPVRLATEEEGKALREEVNSHWKLRGWRGTDFNDTVEHLANTRGLTLSESRVGRPTCLPYWF